MSRNETCRLKVTSECHRTCHYCCNAQPHIKEAWKDVQMSDVAGQYYYYVITGGEPLMNVTFDHTFEVCERLKKTRPCKVYVHTSLCQQRLAEIMPYVDGFTYTLHVATSERDVRQFQRFQTFATFYDELSYHLVIHESIEFELPIIPTVWNRIQPFKPLDPCPIRQDEDLCRLVGYK